MRVPREAVLQFETLEIGEAAALFARVIRKGRSMCDEGFLPLEANLLQVAIDTGQNAFFLLRLDLLDQSVEMGFGLAELLVEVFLKALRNLGKGGRGGLAAQDVGRGSLVIVQPADGHAALRLGARNCGEGDNIGSLRIPLFVGALVDVAGPVDNALGFLIVKAGKMRITHTTLNRYSSKLKLTYSKRHDNESPAGTGGVFSEGAMRSRNASCLRTALC
jgi:hypothetical protein